MATQKAHAQSVIRDQEIEDTLRSYAAPIFDRAGLTPQNVRFIIINSNDLNAFVAGGQNIFFYTGLLLETQTADELLGVIAHETGHIADGHLLRTKETIDNLSTQALLANILTAAAAIGLGSGQAAIASSNLGGSITQRLYLRHSRTQENAADQAGVRFLKESGLPLDGFVSFMDKLASQELLPESQQNPYVRTHPLSRDRVEFLKEQAAQVTKPVTLPPNWAERHARMRAKLEGYLYPERALSRKETDTATQYGRSIALYRKGKTAEALQTLETLIAQEQDNPYFQELKAQILFETGKTDEAVKTYARAVDLLPRSALIRTAYGHSLLESGGSKNVKEAITQLEKSLRSEPIQADGQRFLAIAYGKDGQEGLSRLHLAEAAVLQGKRDIAKREAGLAQTLLKQKTPPWQRAQDILDLVAAAEQRDKD